MAYNAKGQKKYNANSIYFSVKYIPQEQSEGQRVKAYLNQTGQSANSYIKELIKRDLDAKGFHINQVDTDTICTDTSVSVNADTSISTSSTEQVRI